MGSDFELTADVILYGFQAHTELTYRDVSLTILQSCVLAILAKRR